MCQTQKTVAINFDCEQVRFVRKSSSSSSIIGFKQNFISIIFSVVIFLNVIRVTGGDYEQGVNKNETWAKEDLYLGFSGLLINKRKTRLSDSLLDTNSIKVSSNSPNKEQRRYKRGVIHLYNMIVCANGCNPLAYKGYGCYCGFLGSGFITDGIDRCCMMHDRCYDATDCPMFLQYLVPYYWKCFRGRKPICAVEHGKWGGSGSCAQRLCECDRDFAECLSNYPCPTKKAVCTSSPWRLVQNLFMIY
ncbi:uncharacterized protein LOC122499733 [Leptopilina heterotoma]|uniref:uncharacterized protein LOC122499733 n=1 Tax=Leptopilina heterotoma TaxID=63436 RepID=UPI001CA9274F|nr:uncharacterized protein LOC122499733 [Leptopilina heterotoma]